MPKIVVESGMVLNLGGYVVERKARLKAVDVVIGNPLPEDVKIPAPIYDKSEIDELERMGFVVEYIMAGEGLKEKLELVGDKVAHLMGARK
jgi:hypothetical protein